MQDASYCLTFPPACLIFTGTWFFFAFKRCSLSVWPFRATKKKKRLHTHGNTRWRLKFRKHKSLPITDSGFLSSAGTIWHLLTLSGFSAGIGFVLVRGAGSTERFYLLSALFGWRGDVGRGIKEKLYIRLWGTSSHTMTKRRTFVLTSISAEILNILRWIFVPTFKIVLIEFVETKTF